MKILLSNVNKNEDRLLATDCLYKTSTIKLIDNEQLIVYVKHRTSNCNKCIINNVIYFIRRFLCSCQGIFLTKMIYFNKTIVTTSDYFIDKYALFENLNLNFIN